jgi:hypothetical protein
MYCAPSLGRPAADPAAAAAFFRRIGGEIGSRGIGGSAVNSLLAAWPPACQVGRSQWLRSGPHRPCGMSTCPRNPRCLRPARHPGLCRLAPPVGGVQQSGQGRGRGRGRGRRGRRSRWQVDRGGPGRITRTAEHRSALAVVISLAKKKGRPSSGVGFEPTTSKVAKPQKYRCWIAQPDRRGTTSKVAARPCIYIPNRVV